MSSTPHSQDCIINDTVKLQANPKYKTNGLADRIGKLEQPFVGCWEEEVSITK